MAGEKHYQAISFPCRPSESLGSVETVGVTMGVTLGPNLAYLGLFVIDCNHTFHTIRKD
jgi:hypothetical protein